MPRRKRGRDKRRSDKVRNRKQNLHAINVIPFQRIGDPKPELSEFVGGEPIRRWEQREPHKGRSLEDAVVVSHLLRPWPKKIRKVRARPMLQLDIYDLALSSSKLEKCQQYEGKKVYVERDGFWHLQLVDLKIEIASFETEGKAREWAWEHLERA